MPTTVILGTGIIGLSTAYYLSQLADDPQHSTPTPDRPNPPSSSGQPKEKHAIHLVEPCPELFASASGKAAGFLARDWFAPAVAPLGAFSFDLHRELAQAHGGRENWGWTESVSYSLDRDDSDAGSDFDEDEETEVEEDVEEEEESDASADAVTNGHGKESAVHNGNGRAHANRHGHANGEAKSRTKSTDLGWLMGGSSRATLLDEPHVDGDDNEKKTGDAGNGKDSSQASASASASSKDEELPRWLRAKKSALQAISDRTTTGHV